MDFNTPPLEPQPGIVVGRELFAEGNYAVARLPIEAQGNGGDALGSVFNNGDFVRRGMDEPGGGMP